MNPKVRTLKVLWWLFVVLRVCLYVNEPSLNKQMDVKQMSSHSSLIWKYFFHPELIDPCLFFTQRWRLCYKHKQIPFIRENYCLLCMWFLIAQRTINGVPEQRKAGRPWCGSCQLRGRRSLNASLSLEESLSRQTQIPGRHENMANPRSY